MNFKDILKDDIADVFLDPTEFGEEHTVNGTAVTAIIDDDLSEDTVNINLAGETTRGNSGLFCNQRVMYIATKDLPGKPKVNSYMDIDARRYIVKASSVQCGMYKITLEIVGGR